MDLCNKIRVFEWLFYGLSLHRFVTLSHMISEQCTCYKSRYDHVTSLSTVCIDCSNQLCQFDCFILFWYHFNQLTRSLSLCFLAHNTRANKTIWNFRTIDWAAIIREWQYFHVAFKWNANKSLNYCWMCLFTESRKPDHHITEWQLTTLSTSQYTLWLAHEFASRMSNETCCQYGSHWDCMPLLRSLRTHTCMWLTIVARPLDSGDSDKPFLLIYCTIELIIRLVLVVVNQPNILNIIANFSCKYRHLLGNWETPNKQP